MRSMRDILERLSQIDESAIGHEIRNLNGGMEPKDAPSEFIC
jgi:hypothetical protein